MKKWLCKEGINGKNVKYVALFIIVFILNSIYAIQMRGALFSDEIGHLCSIEYLMGNDWSSYVEKIGMGYYKYGGTILYLPLYLLFQDRTQLFVAMLIFNSILLALVPCIIYTIEKKYLNIKEDNEAFMIALMLGLMPASLLFGKTLLSETLLTFLSWLILFLLLKSLYSENKRARYILGGVIGFLSVWAYATHARGVVITILVFILVIALRYWKKIHVVNIPTYLLGVIIGVIADSFLALYLKQHIWNGTAEYNSLSSILDGWAEIDFFFKGIKAIVYTVFGWLYSLCASSYGLAIIGLLVVVCALYRYVLKKEELSEGEVVIYFFSGLYFVGSFVLGLIFMVLGTYRIIYQDAMTRLDQLIYFRYIMVPIQILMFIAVYQLTIKNKWNDYKKKCLSVTLIINLVFFFFISDFFDETQVAILQLCGLPLVPPKSSNVLMDSGEIYGQLLSLAVFNIAIAIILFFWGEHIKKALIRIICVLFVGQYVIWMSNVYFPLSNYYYDKVDLAESFCNQYDIEEDTSIVILGDRTIYSAQYKLYDYSVERIDSEQLDNVLIFTSDISQEMMQSSGTYYQIIDNEQYSQYVLVKGRELKEFLTEKGLTLKKISN